MPASDGYFTDASMIRTVHREMAVALSGPRALLMQATHPVAFAGFFAHTGALDDPYGRLSRTAVVMDTIAFGSRAAADRATRRVRLMHARVAGELTERAGRFPAGTPYRADDPALLLWILATLVDSALLVYGKYVRPLSADERGAYWQEYRFIGRLFGLRDGDMPDTIGDFDAYVHDMLHGGDLHVSDEARELATRIVLRPPVPPWAWPILQVANQATVGLMPGELRRQYGFSWDPGRQVALEAGAQYVRRILLPALPDRLRLVASARAAGLRPPRATRRRGHGHGERRVGAARATATASDEMVPLRS